MSFANSRRIQTIAHTLTVCYTQDTQGQSRKKPVVVVVVVGARKHQQVSHKNHFKCHIRMLREPGQLPSNSYREIEISASPTKSTMGQTYKFCCRAVARAGGWVTFPIFPTFTTFPPTIYAIHMLDVILFAWQCAALCPLLVHRIFDKFCLF